MGPYSTRTGAGYYYAGIAINGLLNYSGGTNYDVAPHIWIGAYYRDTPGSERSDFIVAVKSGTGTTGTGTDIPQTRFKVEYTGDCTATGNITAYSDVRFKKNINLITNPVDKVKQLRGVTYNRTDVDDETREFVGVIAQEVREVLPQVVTEQSDENKTLSVAYGNMVGLLIEAIKEQQKQIEEQKNQINELRDIINGN